MKISSGETRLISTSKILLIKHGTITNILSDIAFSSPTSDIEYVCDLESTMAQLSPEVVTLIEKIINLYIIL